jgi:hypothetical protein
MYISVKGRFTVTKQLDSFNFIKLGSFEDNRIFGEINAYFKSRPRTSIISQTHSSVMMLKYIDF